VLYLVTDKQVDLLMVMDFDQSNLLQEVSITSRIPMAKAHDYGTNECGDYVCVSGYLNCPAHSPFSLDNRPPPVKGKTYLFMYPAAKGYRVGEFTYQGCLWENDDLAIYMARQFYGVDPLKRKSTDEKEYLSTLFWKAFASSSGTAPNNFEFYTGDLTGPFKIKIEGFAADGDFFYEEKDILIKK